MEGHSGQRQGPVTLWVMTGEQTRIKNQYITCPSCKGREYITSLRGSVVMRGEERWFQPVDTHPCPHCKRAYIPIRAEGV